VTGYFEHDKESLGFIKKVWNFVTS